jgi:hypothetical protein
VLLSKVLANCASALTASISRVEPATAPNGGWVSKFSRGHSGDHRRRGRSSTCTLEVVIEDEFVTIKIDMDLLTNLHLEVGEAVAEAIDAVKSWAAQSSEDALAPARDRAAQHYWRALVDPAMEELEDALDSVAEMPVALLSAQERRERLACLLQCLEKAKLGQSYFRAACRVRDKTFLVKLPEPPWRAVAPMHLRMVLRGAGSALSPPTPGHFENPVVARAA